MSALLLQLLARAVLGDPALVSYYLNSNTKLFLTNPAILLADVLGKKRSYATTLEYLHKLLYKGRIVHNYWLRKFDGQVFTTFEVPFESLSTSVPGVELIALKNLVPEEHQYVPGCLYFIYSNNRNIYGSAKLTPQDSQANPDSTGTIRFYELGEDGNSPRGVLYTVQEQDFSSFSGKESSIAVQTFALLVLRPSKPEILRIAEMAKIQEQKRIEFIQDAEEVSKKQYDALIETADKLRKASDEPTAYVAFSEMNYSGPDWIEAERKLYCDEFGMESINFLHKFFETAAGRWILLTNGAQFLIGPQVLVDQQGGPITYIETHDGFGPSEKHILITRQAQLYREDLAQPFVPVGLDNDKGYYVLMGLFDLTFVITNTAGSYAAFGSFEDMLQDVRDNDIPNLVEQ